MAKQQNQDRAEKKGRDKKKGRDSHREETVVRKEKPARPQKAPVEPKIHTTKFKTADPNVYKAMAELPEELKRISREQTAVSLWDRLCAVLEEQMSTKGRKINFTKETVLGLFQLVAWRRPTMTGRNDRGAMDSMLSRLQEVVAWARPEDASDAILGKLVEAMA